MRALVILLLASVLTCGPAAADGWVDLTRRGALQELRTTNPEHFARIVEIVEGLREEPARAETDWLEVNFDAADVDLSKLLIRTSYPPKQSLTFTLDGTRYHLFVTRTDMVPRAIPAH
ncbi:MAG TPA: hypothetical protein VF200_01585 [Woeseiaceae bacterium]|jgi:hypothetical protein